MSALLFSIGIHSAAFVMAVVPSAQTLTVVEPRDPSTREHLAALELQRYFYLRTGELASFSTEVPARGDAILLLRREDARLSEWLGEDGEATARALRTEEFLLKSVDASNGRRVCVVGGDDTGTLYGAYRFCERLGVRYYLHGDVIPEERIAPELPEVDETGRPLFADRGILPFHDFPEGPDWWTFDDYAVHLSQMAKLRMNRIGFHCYPEGGVGPEPLVWIGLPEDVNPDGTVEFAYPSHWAGSLTGTFGYAPTKTGEFAAGAALLFAADDHGSPVTDGHRPVPADLGGCIEVFDRAGRFLDAVFAEASALGIRTVIGTETPLAVPTALQQRLRARGLDPQSPETVARLYEGMFRRIAAAHPLDDYWLWTPEGWTWSGVTQDQVDVTMRDIRLAHRALEAAGHPFGLATSGWVLGPPQQRTLFDEELPGEVAVSCINRHVGFDWVEPGFSRIEERRQWAIPWLEDDPAMILPQLWVGRMRRDAADAHAYGCTGLLGIHWRTKVLAPNIAALASAAWEQRPWNTDAGRRVRLVASQEGRLGGRSADFSREVIESTDEAPIYHTCRWDVDGYHLQVPNGSYSVTLKFCESAYATAGKRVFGIRVQDRTLAEALDVFARVGKNRAHDLVVQDVLVSDEVLKIAFERQVEFPFIAGLVVEGRVTDANQLEGGEFRRRINCGGGAWGEYEADLSELGQIPPHPPGRVRDLPVDDFYTDWARAWFGPEAALELARLTARLDGGNTTRNDDRVHLPRPANWIAGPGGISPNPADWETERLRYAFVDELEALRPRIRGAGNRARFDYWLNTFRFLRAIGELGCARGRLDREVQLMAAETDGARKETLAQAALETRLALARQWEEMMTLLLQTVDTPGELGTVANLEQHVRRNPRDGGRHRFLAVHDDALVEALGRPLPEAANPSRDYSGPPRLIVPTARGRLAAGEPLRLTAIVLDRKPPRSVRLHWRPLGDGSFASAALAHRGRGVHEIAAEELGSATIEYYVSAETASGAELYWPPTAPGLNQTAVINTH